MKLSVVVSVDLDHTSVTIRAAGQLSAQNARGLLAVISRASRTLPDLSVRLDLEHLHSASDEALRLLHQSTADVNAGGVPVFAPPPCAPAPRLAA